VRLIKSCSSTAEALGRFDIELDAPGGVYPATINEERLYLMRRRMSKVLSRGKSKSFFAENAIKP